MVAVEPEEAGAQVGAAAHGRRRLRHRRVRAHGGGGRRITAAGAHRRQPVERRVRRSHAERTAETRARIIAAVVDSIAELGYQRTTAQEIARRAGVTWGAVQHHFGGKDAMMIAVLDDAFARFARRLQDIPLQAPLAARAALFVDRAWAHFCSRQYRSTFEILLNYLGREDLGSGRDWRQRMWRAWNAVWSRLFADSRLPRRRSMTLQHFTISALSGLAATVMLRGTGAPLPKQELALLKKMLVRELSDRRE
jgi:AcrR family transcriptional regulator